MSFPGAVSQAEWHAARHGLLERDEEAARERVLRSYFTSGRGVEPLGSVWTFLDLTPLGCQEEWEDSPAGWPPTAPYTWWRRHDEYEEAR